MKVDLVCKECGKHETGNWCDACAQSLIDNKLCFNCNFWMEKVHKKNDLQIARIQGTHYFIEPDIPKGSAGFRGFDGQEFVIQFDDGKRIVTHNLWCQGEIPAHFRTRLRDNAKFESVQVL